MRSRGRGEEVRLQEGEEARGAGGGEGGLDSAVGWLARTVELGDGGRTDEAVERRMKGDVSVKA